MEKIIRLIIITLATFIVVKATTFGCAMRMGKGFTPSQNNAELEKRLASHVYTLAQEIGERSVYQYEALEKAHAYISEEFRNYGYSVEYQEYTVSGKAVRNIIALKEGKGKPNEIVVVGAHYDSCFNPGADDNASGVAGLLELARAFADTPTGRTIKFIAFVNEEPPFFKTDDMGSRVYARAVRQKNENIRAAIILEMIGYYSDKPHSQRYPLLVGLFFPHRANFISVVGNFPSRSLVRKVVSGFKQKTQFPIEPAVLPSFVNGVDFSDHWSFWQEGYPAVMVTDTAFYRNPHYHMSFDTPGTLDYCSMAEVLKGLTFALIELAR